jgi:hypothetical protein
MNLCIRFSVLPLLLVISISMLGCSSVPKNAEKSLVSERPAQPLFLKNIPANTPYVWASLRPVPLDKYWEMAGLDSNVDFPAIDKYIDWIADEVSTKPLGPSVAPIQTGVRLVQAFVREFRGKLTKEGLESLGLSWSARSAFYGIGVLPVFRTELNDPSKFLSLIDRLEKETGVVGEKVKQGDVEYRRYQLIATQSSPDGEGGVRQDGLFMALSIHGRDAVVGLSLDSTAETFLPVMLGLTEPTPSMASDNRLQAMNDKFGLGVIGSGYFDVVGTVGMFIDPVPGLTNDILVPMLDLAGASPVDELSEACRIEFMQFARNFPRVVTGYPKVAAGEVVTLFGMETSSQLGTELEGVQVALPGTRGVEPGDLMAFGTGVNMEGFVGLLQDWARRIQRDPYQCEDLSEVSAAADMGLQYLAIIPPVFRQLRGMVFVLKDFQMTWSEEEQALPLAQRGPPSDAKIEAFSLIDSLDAQSLYESLRMIGPGLPNLTPDGAVVQLDWSALAAASSGGMEFQSSPPAWVPPVFLSMTKTRLGFAVGEVGREILASQIVAGASQEPPALMLVKVDYERLFRLFPDMLSPESPDEAEALNLFRQMMSWKVLMKLAANPNGVLATSTMTNTVDSKP